MYNASAAVRSEAIASRLEAIALRLEVIPTRFLLLLGWRPSLHQLCLVLVFYSYSVLAWSRICCCKSCRKSCLLLEPVCQQKLYAFLGRQFENLPDKRESQVCKQLQACQIFSHHFDSSAFRPEF